MPYVLWVAVYYLYFCSQHYFDFRLPDLLGYMFVGNLASHFYFVIVILQFYILVPVWRAIFLRSDPTLTIAFSLPVTYLFARFLPDMLLLLFPSRPFLHNDKMITTYLAYWTIGCYIGLFYDRFLQIAHKNRRLIALCYSFACLLNISLSYLAVSGGAPVPYLESVQQIYVLSAVIFFYSTAIRVTEKTRIARLPVVGLIDSASYLIYLSHCLVLVVADRYLFRLGIADIGRLYLLRAAIVYIVSISGCAMYQTLRKKLVFRRAKT